MMIGLGDRHAIRERPPVRNQPGQKQGDGKAAGTAKPADTTKSAETPKPGAASKPAETNKAEDAADTEAATVEQPATVAPEQTPARLGQAVTYEFRSDKWTELYSKRIDDTIAALKSKRVPVIWVGLPPIRGARSRGDLSFLNDLYRDRAEKAGIPYVDVWDGFIEESGEFSTYGPDVLGQVRRLRSGDGVHFTKAGARKLAHYVEREIRRVLTRATPVALPVQEEPQKPAGPAQPSGPAPRPVAGPVIPLTGHIPAGEGLVGGGSQGAPVADPLASRVLVKGEAMDPARGRADDFAWPRPAAAEQDVAPPEPVAPAARPTQQPQQQRSRTTTRPSRQRSDTQGAAPTRAVR